MRIRTHTNPFNYFERLEPLALDSIFSNSEDPLDIEIGFGRGVFIRNYALKNPNRRIIGVDIRKPIVDVLADRLREDHIQNVHLVHGNGELVVSDALPDNSLSKVFIFHPDPWFKKRHHKRRVVNSRFLPVLKKKCRSDALIYVSTDVEVLWHDMNESMQANGFTLRSDDPFWTSEYGSHWTDFTRENQRSIFSGTYFLSV